MANFLDAVWNAAQYKLNDMMNMPEYKHKASAAIQMFLGNTDFLVPASERERLWNQKPSDSSSVELYTINKQASDPITGRTYNHTGNNGDATKTSVTYVTRGEQFKYSIKQSEKSVFEMGDMLAKQLLSAAINTHGVIETYLTSWLNTNKSQVVTSLTPTGGSWDATNFIFDVAKADENLMFQRIRGFMRQQYYKGNYNFLHDEFAAQKAEYLIQQGQGNNTNYNWQMAGLNGYASQEIVPATNYDSQGYVIPMGTIGLLPWLPMKNREGFGDTFQNGGKFRTLPDPLGTGLQFAVHEYATGADNQATYGERQDVDVEVEISLDFAAVKAPMSTANASPIFKTGLKDS